MIYIGIRRLWLDLYVLDILDWGYGCSNPDSGTYWPGLQGYSKRKKWLGEGVAIWVCVCISSSTFHFYNHAGRVFLRLKRFFWATYPQKWACFLRASGVLSLQRIHQRTGNMMIWLVVYLPLWKIWVRQLGFLLYYSQYMESHKIPWFQSPPSSDQLWVFSIQHFHQCGLLGDCWALDKLDSRRTIFRSFPPCPSCFATRYFR